MSEWLEIAEWDWVWVGQGERLHAVKEITNDADEDWYGVGVTECGLYSGYLNIPGIFSRMSAQRCLRCCERTGMPQGSQSPKNVDECKPVAQARIARRAAAERNCSQVVPL